MKNVVYSYNVPRWISELYDYENSVRPLITLSGTINPNPLKYRMIKMTRHMLRGVATIEDLVEFEYDADEEIDQEELKKLAEKEFLQTHPNYEYVEWVGDSLVD